MKSILIVLMAFVSTNLYAGTETGTVSILYPSGGSKLYFRLEGTTCKTSRYWFYHMNSESSKVWSSMLLAAATTRSQVSIVFDGECDPNIHQEISYLYQSFSS